MQSLQTICCDYIHKHNVNYSDCNEIIQNLIKRNKIKFWFNPEHYH